MSKFQQGQQGFTLLEIMVVVVIIAVMSGFSVLAVSQAAERRYAARAGDLQAWLQQVVELAMLEGSPYGVRIGEDRIEPLVYYRDRWYRLATPEPFGFGDEATLELLDAAAPVAQSADEDFPVPDLVMMPGGYLEPAARMRLSFSGADSVFVYDWDGGGPGVQMRQEAL